MFKAILVAGLVILLGGDEDLDKAAAKAGEMTNYSFTTKVDMGKQNVSVTVNVQADSAWHFKGAETEAYRKGEKLVYKDGEAWKVLEKMGKPEAGSKPDKKQIALQMLARMKAPHENLKGIGAKFKEVKREDSDGGKCFSGELTPEAAKEFAQGGMGKGGQGNVGGDASGSAKIWVNGDGAITKYEIITKATIKEKEITKTSTVELSDVGSTKYEVPEDAKKALE